MLCGGVQSAMYFRSPPQQQHVDSAALMNSGTGELFERLTAAIHQLTSSLASSSQGHQQQQQQDVAYHHSIYAADHIVQPSHS